MSDSIDQIKAELESLGYETCLFDSSQGKVVSFSPYIIEAGSHEGKPFKVGISMHGNKLYPEYPPHWIHVSPPINDGRGGSSVRYSANGREWIALSRPPGDIWDQLPTKHMSTYLTEHLRRFWNNI